MIQGNKTLQNKLTQLQTQRRALADEEQRHDTMAEMYKDRDNAGLMLAEEAQKQRANSKIDSLDKEIAQIEAQIQQNNQRIAQLDAEITQLDEQHRAKSDERMSLDKG